MRTKSLFIPILMVAILAACLAPQAAAQQKYAVLISAGCTTADDTMINSEYWYDLFFMYRMLIDRGFTHNHIFVLYCNGTDFGSAHANYQTGTVFPGLPQITDFATTKANVTNIFNWLATGDAAHGVPQVQPGDFLFYWWMGHGSWDGDDVSGNHLYHANISNTGEQVTDAEFANLFKLLPACVIKTVFVMTCHSGALQDDIQGLHMMAHTSSRYDQSSFSDFYDVVHADFSYFITSALRQLTPTGAAVASDANGDGILTVQEANTYAHAQTTSSETVVGDYRGIAPKIVLANAQPADPILTEFVYSRDCAEDNGAVPPICVSTTWYEGPDLWVRWTNDGLTELQNPEFGQPNFVYARVHNIGCTTLDATAALSWSEPSAWMTPAAWHPIPLPPLPPTVAVNNLVPGESRVISAEWDDVPLPGKYCLHDTLNAPGDPANASGQARMDNNKVQLNVTVEDTVWGWVKKYYWWLENGSKEKTLVDLVVTKPVFAVAAQAPKIQLQLPAGLTFSRVTGSEIVQSKLGPVLEIPAQARRVVVQGISLGPLEKREAVLSVTLPQTLGRTNSVTVQVAEQVKGQEMGGIVFQTRAAPQGQVLAHSIRQLQNFSRVLGEAAKSESANKLAALCQKTRGTAPESSKAFTAFMQDMVKLEPGLRADFGRLLGAQDAAVMNAALDELAAAVKTGNVGGFVTAQEAMFHASKPFFRKRTLK
ncbi:MAG: hypothetical protein ABSH05_01880 [Bryobacteraceae bacterium]